MAGGGQFIKLLSVSNSPSSLVKPSRPFFYNLIMRYGQATKENSSRLMEAERAPSIAEEFERVAEEKAKEANQGVASQTTDKALEGAQEATTKSVKGKFKGHGPGTDYRRKG
ncbi:hypothetical protein L6164_031092 [Bauhinia variegata]|uniref:Uncharacterized protein n=1 Tax=Bauhinia variegata TaxID=167791 RepID=A0ACB9LEE1_BAUVA|nr:hypothetical protein L6164_031092 [Bauhinia variegata]